LKFLLKDTESCFCGGIGALCFLHGKWLKSPCTLCGAAAYCCGAVALGVTAALLGRFLPRLGPLAHNKRPFFLARLPVDRFRFDARPSVKRKSVACRCGRCP